MRGSRKVDEEFLRDGRSSSGSKDSIPTFTVWVLTPRSPLWAIVISDSKQDRNEQSRWIGSLETSRIDYQVSSVSDKSEYSLCCTAEHVWIHTCWMSSTRSPAWRKERVDICIIPRTTRIWSSLRAVFTNPMVLYSSAIGILSILYVPLYEAIFFFVLCQGQALALGYSGTKPRTRH